MKKDITNKLSPDELIQLKQANDVIETINTPGWDIISAFIQQNVTFPNPDLYEVIEELILPYTKAYGAAELAKRIGTFVRDQEDVVKNLTDKAEGRDGLPNYSIGS